MNSYVYMLVNTVNNKAYIGQSKSPERRCKAHLRDLRMSRHKNPHLQNAYDMCGEEAFDFYVVDSAPVGQQIDYLEEWHIKRTWNWNYNIKKQVETPLLAEETKQKISEALMGNTNASGETSAETRQRISEALSGRPKSDEARRNMSLGQRGRKRGSLSEETKRKIGEANRGKARSPELREHLSRIQRGRKLSEETRAKMKIAQKRRRLREKGAQ